MSVDYSKLANQVQPQFQQWFSGVDPDWTQLAMAYGYMPNPFPAAGTEGQDAMRYMATMKNIMDQQLGGPNGRYSQMSPGNPIASMPYGMRQWFSGAAPIFNSVQGRNLMPGGQADMFGGGYQFGGLDTSTPSALMQLLQTGRSNTPVGGSTIPTTAGPASALPTTTPAALPAGGESSAAQAQAAQNANTQNAQGNSAAQAVTNVQPTRPGSEIAQALQTLDQERTAAQQNIANNPAAKREGLDRAVRAYLNWRDKTQSEAKSHELEIPRNIANQFASWLEGVTGTRGT